MGGQGLNRTVSRKNEAHVSTGQGIIFLLLERVSEKKM